jgi:hypothetical protein
MKKRYAVRDLLVISFALFIVAVASCKKDSATKSTNDNTVKNATPAEIGLYESDSSIYKLIYLDVSKVGTQEIDDGMVFDTGSGGMVLDAKDVLPASMITSTGFNFNGADSLVYNGITIEKDTSHVEYGDDANTAAYVYGNLAYADVTIDQEGGGVTIKRLPFFLYYKAVDGKGVAEPQDEFDVFGVNEEYDVTFNNGAEYITSPLSYYTPGTGLDKGFKMAALGTSNFSLDGNYVKNVVTLGLTSADTQSNGFTLNSEKFYAGDGYLPYLPGTITYGGNTINAEILFDTGTEPYNYIEDKSATTSHYLAANSAVTVSTNTGFNYTFTVTTTNYLTYVENPNTSDESLSIFSLEYFLDNEYMMDFTTHQIGCKNN